MLKFNAVYSLKGFTRLLKKNMQRASLGTLLINFINYSLIIYTIEGRLNGDTVPKLAKTNHDLLTLTDVCSCCLSGKNYVT